MIIRFAYQKDDSDLRHSISHLENIPWKWNQKGQSEAALSTTVATGHVRSLKFKFIKLSWESSVFRHISHMSRT